MDKEKNTINILGINISGIRKIKILEKIKNFLIDGKQHQITTPNPEIILKALDDEELFYILNNSDLAVADGVGLKFAALAMAKNLHRFTGADLVKEILKIAEEKNLKAEIINWDKGLSRADDIIKVLEEKYPSLEFVVEDTARTETAAVESQNISPPREVNSDILFCTLGAPYQEKWIYRNLGKLPSVKLAIGVGGAFDFLTGKIKRSPKFFRLIGMEWFWRLILEPRYRFKRIINAVIIFPCKFIKWRFILPFLYRPNVACILYKKDGDKYKILLVQRSDQEDHWQLPQGGTDGEILEKAGEREIREEIGTDRFKLITCYKNLYKYQFKEKHGKYNIIVKNIIGYKGQRQGLCIAEFLGSDKDIKINFWDHKAWKWADSDSILDEVHAYRKEPAKIFLEKFKEVVKYEK